MTDLPGRYDIDALLNSGNQPFDDLDETLLKAMGRSLSKTDVMAVPVAVAADGTLIDGHQRLKALKTKNRRFIDGKDVRVLPDVNRANALEWSVRLNVARRQLSLDEKAAVARQLQRERRWSQAKIAEIFGVSRPAVSQWLAKTKNQAGETPPPVVEGRDGHLRDVSDQQRRLGPVQPGPLPVWDPEGGEAATARKQTMRTIGVMHRLLDQAPIDVNDENERAVLRQSLQHLSKRASALVDALDSFIGRLDAT